MYHLVGTSEWGLFVINHSLDNKEILKQNEVVFCLQGYKKHVIALFLEAAHYSKDINIRLWKVKNTTMIATYVYH